MRSQTHRPALSDHFVHGEAKRGNSPVGVLNNRTGGAGRGRTQLRKARQFQNSAQQSRDKAVIRPDYHARQPRLNWNVAGETKGWMESLLCWRHGLMSAGKVVFHSALQPTKKMVQEQYEPF